MQEYKFQDEVNQTLEIIPNDSNISAEVCYFIDLYRHAFDPKTITETAAQIISLGCDLPMEIIYAFSERPHYVIGGNIQSIPWAEDFLPRDAYPICKSALGYLLHFDIAKQAIVLTTVRTDSDRKTLGLLNDIAGEVYFREFSPLKHRQLAQKRHIHSLKSLILSLEKHMGCRLTATRLRSAYEQVSAAKSSLHEFVSPANTSALNPTLSLLVSRSILVTDNLCEWTQKIGALTRKLKEHDCDDNSRPNVIVAGSSIAFPNYKIPQLLSECEMNVQFVIDDFSMNMLALPPALPETMTKKNMLHPIFEDNLQGGTLTYSEMFNNELRLRIGQYNPDGIILHVLKGDLEYDFDFPIIEKIAASAGVKIMKLETDYFSHDAEQLRTRMQAFCEVLRSAKEDG